MEQVYYFHLFLHHSAHRMYHNREIPTVRIHFKICYEMFALAQFSLTFLYLKQHQLSYHLKEDFNTLTLFCRSATWSTSNILSLRSCALSVSWFWCELSNSARRLRIVEELSSTAFLACSCFPTCAMNSATWSNEILQLKLNLKAAK